MGHILLTRPSGEQRATLVPPLTGEHPFGKIRKWIAQNPVKMTFVSELVHIAIAVLRWPANVLLRSLPLPLLNTSPAQQSVKHRLIYHALGSGTNGADGESQDIPTSPSLPIRRRKVLSLEATLVEPSTVESRHVARDHTLLPQLDLEDELSFKEEGGTQPLPTYRSRPAEPSVPILDASGVHCWTGVEADLNLMIPDRSVRLSLSQGWGRAEWPILQFSPSARWISNSPFAARPCWRNRDSRRNCSSMSCNCVLSASFCITEIYARLIRGFR